MGAGWSWLQTGMGERAAPPENTATAKRLLDGLMEVSEVLLGQVAVAVASRPGGKLVMCEMPLVEQEREKAYLVYRCRTAISRYLIF
jgi:hypothetical protein